MRKGQKMFNFLEWLKEVKHLPSEQSHRLADPFYLTDKEWDKYMAEYDELLANPKE